MITCQYLSRNTQCTFIILLRRLCVIGPTLELCYNIFECFADRFKHSLTISQAGYDWRYPSCYQFQHEGPNLLIFVSWHCLIMTVAPQFPQVPPTHTGQCKIFVARKHQILSRRTTNTHFESHAFSCESPAFCHRRGLIPIDHLSLRLF